MHDLVRYQPSSAPSLVGTSMQTGHTDGCFFFACFCKEIFIQRHASDIIKLSGPVLRPAHVFHVSLPAVFDAANRSASYSSWEAFFFCWASILLPLDSSLRAALWSCSRTVSAFTNHAGAFYVDNDIIGGSSMIQPCARHIIIFDRAIALDFFHLLSIDLSCSRQLHSTPTSSLRFFLYLSHAFAFRSSFVSANR